MAVRLPRGGRSRFVMAALRDRLLAGHSRVLPCAVGTLVGVGVALLSSTVAADPLTADEQSRYSELAVRKLRDFTDDDLKDYIHLRRKQQTGDPDRPSPTEEIRHFASRALGTQHRLNAPRFELAQAGCVTFVERSIAMGLATDLDAYRRICDRLRHKDGKVDLLERNFFTLADWVPNDSWLLRDITSELGVEPTPFKYGVFRRRFLANLHYGRGSEPTAITAYEVQLGAFPTLEEAAEAIERYATKGVVAIADRQPRGDRFLWIVLLQYPSHAEAVAGLARVRPIQPSAMLTERSKAAAKAAKVASAPEKEVLEDCFISREHVSSVLPRLRPGDVCLIIRSRRSAGMEPWLYCDHMGFIDVSADDGSVMFVHSAPPAARRDGLEYFLERHRHVAGVKILRIRENTAIAETVRGPDEAPGAVKDTEQENGTP